ncbi:AAA family ATPase [Weeksellaceae bacterium TAE3-ERU29]|nr:AAA family ATPase [Weeksellaceae bacterium TAE3-ERU29]
MTIFDYFQHITLTNDQRNAVEQFASFLESDKRIFILKGYAGSGKTTLLKGFVQYLEALEKNNYLMAPTGRAAKVINQKTKFKATTIHKRIYSLDGLEEIEEKNNSDEDKDVSFIYQYKLRNDNEAHHSIFIVDEASMISNVLSQGEFFRFGDGYLLDDLVSYSQVATPNAESKIIFVGDPAQLPPIRMNFSPALDEKYLKEKYDLDAVSVEMKEVKRQDTNNGILHSATNLRKCLTSGYFNDFDLRANNKDIFNPSYENFIETYKAQTKKKIIICYQNKTALGLNKTIRENKFGKELPIQPSDIVIIGNNNYNLDIMNGEFAVVVDVDSNTEKREISYNKRGGGKERVTLEWRKITLKMRSEDNGIKIVEGLMLENYLYGDNYLTREEQIALYIDFKNRNPKLKPKTEPFKESLKSDKYFNCIQLKYGYAITCHKAQGGEWDNAFVFWDKGTKKGFNFCASEQTIVGKDNADFYRWAYTAVTRASEKLFCINPPHFSSHSEMNFIDIQVQKAFDKLTGTSSHSIELELTEDINNELKKFHLEDAPLPIQDHFIERWYHLRKHYIDIFSWERVGYEIRYLFKRGDETASFKYWVNGKNEFKSNFQKIPKQTSSDELFNTISKILESSEKIVVNRNNAEGILTQVAFHFEIEENSPFLNNLYDHLSEILKEKGIFITDVTHLDYKERYTFEKGNTSCVIDFEYNGGGFFGRVLPLEKKCNNQEILDTVKQAINHIKYPEYVK